MSFDNKKFAFFGVNTLIGLVTIVCLLFIFSFVFSKPPGNASDTACSNLYNNFYVKFDCCNRDYTADNCFGSSNAYNSAGCGELTCVCC
jgi:hypothetical protein